MKTDWKSLCAELYGIFEKYDDESNLAGIYWDMKIDKNDVLDRARAALAEADGPAVPEGREPASVVGEPSDDELQALADQFWVEETAPFEEEHYAFARAALARWGHQPAPPAAGEQRHPEPVPVSERLPGPELCWWWIEPDEDDDDSGYGGSWTLLRIRGNKVSYTHWLPAHALPLPAGEVEP